MTHFSICLAPSSALFAWCKKFKLWVPSSFSTDWSCCQASSPKLVLQFIWILFRQYTSRYAGYMVILDFMAQSWEAQGLMWFKESPPSPDEVWFYVPVDTIRELSSLLLLFLFSSRGFPQDTLNFPCPPKPTPQIPLWTTMFFRLVEEGHWINSQPSCKFQSFIPSQNKVWLV